MNAVMLAGARTLGKLAGRKSRPVTECPYSTQGDDDQRAAARAWVGAWLRWSPPKSIVTNFDSDEPAP